LQQFEKGFTVLDWDRQLQRDAVGGIEIGVHWSDSCGSGFRHSRESGNPVPSGEIGFRFRGNDEDRHEAGTSFQLARPGGFRLATAFPAFANKARACGSSSTAFST